MNSSDVFYKLMVRFNDEWGPGEYVIVLDYLGKRGPEIGLMRNLGMHKFEHPDYVNDDKWVGVPLSELSKNGIKPMIDLVFLHYGYGAYYEPDVLISNLEQVADSYDVPTLREMLSKVQWKRTSCSKI